MPPFTGKARFGLIACMALMIPLSAAGQVATALVVEGQPLADGPPDNLVTAINNSAVNHAGGYAFTVNSAGGSGTLAHVWGAAAGGPGSILRTEGTFGDYQQDSFEAFFGIADDGTAAYSPSCTNLANGHTGLDAVWLGDDFLAVEELPYPYQEGWYWSFGSRPGATADGNPFWVGGITDSEGGATLLRGLFYGADASPVLVGGDYAPGVPEYPVMSAGIDFDVRFSRLGTYWIDMIQLDTGSSLDDDWVLVNGNTITFDSPDPVRENNPVPPGVGGLPGELWDNFDFFGVTEDGVVMFTGDTDAAIEVDEFIFVHDTIRFRESDEVDGFILSGAIEGAYLNEDGDVAYIWDVVSPGGTEEALFLNDRLLLKVGDSVDLDGDGEVEPTSILDAFTGISSLTLSDRDGDGRVRVYFTADVETPGAPLRVASGLPTDLDAGGLDAAATGIGGERGDRLVVEGGFELAAAITTGVDELPATTHALGGNYPNPFNPSTKIVFTLAFREHVTLEVLSVDGRRIATLIDGPRGAGVHEADWKGCDADGHAVASGLYLYRLRAGNWEQIRTMVLLK